MGSLVAVAAAVVCAACGLRGQALQIDLRDGSTLSAGVLVSSGGGFEVIAESGRRRIAAGQVLAIRGAPARAPQLLHAELVGGDIVYGALVGGDEAGDRLELLSPVLGQLSLPVDRLAALVHPGVEAAGQQLPEGIDEALYVTTGRGFDLVAGTLHRFGSRGVLFQPETAEQPRWFAAEQFSSLRLAGGLGAEDEARCTLVTRTADRLRVTFEASTADGVAVRSATGVRCLVRWADLAALVFRDGVVHLGELQPKEVVESGCDGDVVWPFRVDRCAVGGELLAGGRAYGLGLGVHSRSRLSFVVPEGARFFVTRVGIDDSAGELGIEAHATARVLRDNQVLFEVEALRAGTAPRSSGLLAVEPGETISLEADFGEGRDLGDRIDWLLPMFLVKAP